MIEIEVQGGTINDTTEFVTNSIYFEIGEIFIIFYQENPFRWTDPDNSKINIFDSKVYFNNHEYNILAFKKVIRVLIKNPNLRIDSLNSSSGGKTDLPLTVPTITNISPNMASAGTNTQVVITGTNFGATQGASKVYFFYRSGQPKIQAPVTSWSNTTITCTVPVTTMNGYPASSSSGPVTITTGSGTSNGFIYKISFGYGGVKWPGSNPSVQYKVNENTSDCTGEGVAVQSAATSWNTAGANFSLTYTGTHTHTTASQNSVNEIMWGNTSGSIATTYFWSSGSNLIECDIVFNDPNYTWSTSSTCPSGKYDVQTVAVHEFGHWLNLMDLYGNIGDGFYDVAKVMYGFGNAGTVKRNLHNDDRNGIQWIYGISCLDCPNYNFTISPTSTWQTHSSSHVTNGCKIYKLSVSQGKEYTFKTGCGDGATANYDTWLDLLNSNCNLVAYDDDGCNTSTHQSLLTWTATYSGYAYLKVRGYNGAGGSYTLAYRCISSCLICPSYDFTISASTSWQNHSSSHSTNGCRIYKISVSVNKRYTFKTGCGDGATANYDTYLELFNSNCTMVASDNDGCTYGRSIINWTANYSGYAYLKVRGYNGAGGSYTLAYRYQNVKDQIILTEDPIGLEDDMIVYPNPANESFTLQKNNAIDQCGILTLQDMTGKVILNIELQLQEGINNYTVSIAGISEGMYIVRLQTGTRVGQTKLVINR